MGQNAPTSGGGTTVTPMRVSTAAAFKTAITGAAPAIVYLTGSVTGDFAIGTNKTVVGLCGAEVHGHIDISRSSNIIVRNLKIVGYGVGDCSLDPSYNMTVGCSSGADAVTIQDNSHHVWFDHDDISDGTDGNLDTVSGSDFVTISWTKFHYTPRTDPTGNDSTGAEGHRFSNLIGSADNVPTDVGHLNITWHHDWWADNVNQRMPRSRYGKIHMLNNLFTSTGNSYCTNAGLMATLLVEGNAYIGVKGPLQPNSNGDMLAPTGSNLFQNTNGLTVANGTGFTPPYTYTVDPATMVSAEVMAGAGPH
jgi:pectate lyase